MCKQYVVKKFEMTEMTIKRYYAHNSVAEQFTISPQNVNHMLKMQFMPKERTKG